jgi:hypothetical protein
MEAAKQEKGGPRGLAFSDVDTDLKNFQFF